MIPRGDGVPESDGLLDGGGALGREGMGLSGPGERAGGGRRVVGGIMDDDGESPGDERVHHEAAEEGAEQDGSRESSPTNRFHLHTPAALRTHTEWA